MRPQPIRIDVTIHIITPEKAIWFSTPTSALILHPLLITDFQVLVFLVFLMNTCALCRRDSTGMVLLVSQTQC